VIRGAEAVANRAVRSADPAGILRPALVNGAAGVFATMSGRPHAVFGFIVADGKIMEIDTIVDPERVGRIAASVVTDEW
jgi:RNA polymerase sigma-70 factor (ECF subfamily)